MKLKKVINKAFQAQEEAVSKIIHDFSVAGKPFGDQERNSLKLFDLNKRSLVVKSFRIPNLLNQIVYKFFRKSKAQRSFEYANKLKNLGIGTPEPIAYYEFTTPFLFKNSFYISAHLDCDLTFRELTTDLNYPDHENILRAFTRFTFELHEKNINFLDHSPGNTLINKVGEEYQFYLVDLNRMKFKSMSFQDRIKNISRLTLQDELVTIMSDEYAKMYNVSYKEVYTMLWKAINTFQNKIKRKNTLKKKLLFRK